MSKMLLIDGNSILNRAFYGIKNLSTKDGRHTNALYGFMTIFLKQIQYYDGCDRRYYLVQQDCCKGRIVHS